MNYPKHEEGLLIPDVPRRTPYYPVSSALELIAKITGEKLDVNVTSDEELLSFLHSPEKFTDNPDIKAKIADLAELLSMMEGV